MSQQLEQPDVGREDPEKALWWNKKKLSRRQMLIGAAGAGAAAVLGGMALAQETPEVPWKVPGSPTSARGTISPFEVIGRAPVGTPFTSFTPLQNLNGIITPSGVHFERHHNGVPQLDPRRYKLIVHGLVERPMAFTLADLKRYPAVSRFHFVECSGNSGGAFINPRREDTAQSVHGLTSTSDWAGVLMSTIMKEVRPLRQATWALFESYDAALMTRSVPVEKLWEDAMLAYGQNGEAIRPEQGYPVRSLLPGFEGNSQVKWVRRIEFGNHPWDTREETSKYTDPACPPGDECHARQYTFIMDAKSVITFPSGGQTVPSPGLWEIHGIAWSGRGFIQTVEISTDGGRTWFPARLEEPVLPKCHTRFRYLWNWDGRETIITSRATDSTGYVQPSRQELIDLRGLVSGPTLEFMYHANFIQPWRIGADGRVTNGLV